MCPGLPGDPPGPETLAFFSAFWLMLGLGVALACVLHARWQRDQGMGRTLLRTALLGAGLSFALCVCSCLNIVARHHGHWADLKHELARFTEDARRYEAAHGKLDEQSVSAFYAAQREQGREQLFSFGPNGPAVHIVYRWWAVPPRPMIVWGHGSSAGFDLETMICDAFD